MLLTGTAVVIVTAGLGSLATVAMLAGIGVIGAACGIMADALREVSEEVK